MANFSLQNQKTLLSQIYESFRNGFQLIKSGHVPVFFQELMKRVYSESISVGLRRSLEDTFPNPDARIEITVRPIQEGDFDFLMENGKLEKTDPRQVANHRSLVEANIPHCYVAVNKDDQPCFMQWLIGPESNHLIKKHFGDSFPPLKSDEALLEGAYMQRTFRGKRIMPAAMSRITEQARNMDVKWVQTFVDVKNIPSLKGCKRSGFTPYIEKNDRWLLFRRSITFKPVSEEVLASYQKAVGS